MDVLGSQGWASCGRFLVGGLPLYASTPAVPVKEPRQCEHEAFGHDPHAGAKHTWRVVLRK
eukprot:1054145-Pyramimonas_sp.AAC.1